MTIVGNAGMKAERFKVYSIGYVNNQGRYFAEILQPDRCKTNKRSFTLLLRYGERIILYRMPAFVTLK
jgi:hypothetical protein